MGSITFALIGCGRIAKNHVGALTALPQARLVAVCDLLPERSEPWARQLGIPAYTNYHTMLRREHIDVVCILTPSGMHPSHAIDVMQRYGAHVVIEKPMALACTDLARMESVAERCGVRIFPIYQNRYNRAVQRVRRDIESGVLGRVVLATVRVRWCRPQRYYDRDPWRGTWAMDGGALTNQGIHYLDLLQYLAGQVEAVSARTATQLVRVEVEDTGVATLKFQNGALGVVEITTAARPDDFDASVSVLAENGSVELAGIACNRLRLYTPDPTAGTEDSEDFPDAYGYGLRPFFHDVVTDLQGGAHHPMSFDEGARAIRLLNAIYRSAEDNREVRMDEDVTSARLGRPDPALFALYNTPLPVD
jgi:UDP-N-acetyl-2-amino-2-deoxyglucuronate dehydrogenase